MIDEGFNTEMAVDIIEKLEDGEDIYNYLQSDEYFKNFKNQLSLMIEEKEIDKKELQKKLGRVNLNNWLNGKVVPNRANLIKICFALKCSQEESGVHVTPSKHVDAPIIEEYPLTLECTVESFEDGNLIGNVVNVSIDEDYLDENGKIDVDKMEIIAFDMVNNTYRVLGENVGKAFKDGFDL